MALCLWNSVPLDYGYSSTPSHLARVLNWMSDWPIQDSRGDCRDPENFCWSKQDFEQVKSASFIFAAAHVIYSDDLTIALFRMLRRVMTFGCDKDWRNDTTSALMIVANGYTCFRSYVKEDATGEQEENRSFVGKRIDVTQIPQYLKGYDRGDDVELWEIKYVL
ncbi:unnamed protein product [Arabidopsis lyrata]|uniref:Methyltransferase n=1 Tax=Arabidopsis lyrata subsp. lyrata TaxID=81972 RepID=D7KXN6_ARALL|nr:hypothetical protein ARALYDRAFT_896007 [Arabidopsis lyrata subsp. lyrata]CAH8258842.1 unnamed protein product [Arabidopsis lyrata]